jgi:protein arginine kinase activator
MLCQVCNSEEATIYMSKIVNGKKTQMHICKNCANQKDSFNFDGPFTIHSLLSGLLDIYNDSPSKMGFDMGSQCQNCGMTFNKFKQLGKFGCDNCYQTFGQRLSPMLKRIHGDIKHEGKIPKRSGGTIKIKKEVEILKKELNQAVTKEEFERAATLRDKIKELEKQIASE